MRWSLDLRWQNPQHPAGTFGLKQLIPMTAEAAAVMAQQSDEAMETSSSSVSSSSKGYDIPWEGWMNQSRQVEAATVDKGAAATLDVRAADVSAADVSTIVVGPWLDTWEIGNESKHTKAWKSMKHKTSSSTATDNSG